MKLQINFEKQERLDRNIAIQYFERLVLSLIKRTCWKWDAHKSQRISKNRYNLL